MLKETIFLIISSLFILLILSIALSFLIPILLPEWTDAINITILFSLILPIKQLSSYISFAIKSKEVNKLIFEPIMYVIATYFIDRSITVEFL